MDNFQANIVGESISARRRTCKEYFERQRIIWKAKIDENPISFGANVLFLMQGIAYTPQELKDPWHLPSADSRRPNIGLCYGKHGFSGGGCPLPNNAKFIQKMLTDSLVRYGIPEEHIPQVI